MAFSPNGSGPLPCGRTYTPAHASRSHFGCLPDLEDLLRGVFFERANLTEGSGCPPGTPEAPPDGAARFSARRVAGRDREAHMSDEDNGEYRKGHFFILLAIGLALGICTLDILSPLQGAVAVLYTSVIVLVGLTHRQAPIVMAAAGCASLAIAGYCASHWGAPLGSPAMRLGVSLVALMITTVLVLRQLREVEERERADARYRTIFAAGGFPIWESDWSGAHGLLHKGHPIDACTVELAFAAAFVKNANLAAACLFGFERREDLVGRSLLELATPATSEALVRIYEALMHGASSVEEETRFVSRTGREFDILLQVTIPPDHDGWKRILIMGADITERKRAQERLAAAQIELAHISRVTILGELAASIAHEVNQPLTATITYARSAARWLAREAPDAHEVSECLSAITANAERAAQVIARIRDLARNSDVRHAQISLSTLIAETLELVQREMTTKGVTLTLNIESDLPPVTGDKVQLQQVLLNLLINARQAMLDTPEERRHLTVRAFRKAEKHIAVEVHDTGHGLAAGQDNLFTPFFTTKRDGMGMGFAICRTIMGQHEGSIEARSNAKGGATFVFVLPMKTDHVHGGSEGLVPQH
ncbi:nitrogen regulation protein NR(II) [Novosphingobium sp. BW1]|uniref:two-component system sensor histidine kinase NtrB n=1 Tax=Novosphingobium sp. BW1 TaxID=2592621 RepID=UPI0011DEA820|nr:ATP-binding protein [Novosphingobium sp. BW1]TYC91399.1 PAS domain S-box protein [Novosphingobium sp. BW1]